MARTIRSRRVFKDPDFPLACMRLVDHGATAVHGHDFHELVLILAGSGRHIMDGVEYPIAAGDVFVVRGAMRHGYRRTDRVTLVNILYHPRRLGLPLHTLRDTPGYNALFRVEPRLPPPQRCRNRFRLSEEALAEATGLVFRLEEELRAKRPGYRGLACAHLMHLIGFLARAYSETANPLAPPLRKMGEVLSYIEGHLHEPLSVRDLTRVAGMSESSLLRAFRRILGRSPLEYVIRARILRAADLLRRGDVRVTEAAFACGFNDSNYFSRQFRRHTGMTPRAWRRTALGAAAPPPPPPGSRAP